jgi:hypothetical protein
MSWPKNFPNADHHNGQPLQPDHPQWRPVPGRPGVYIHDDVPTQEVEIIIYQCLICQHEQQTVFSLGSTTTALAAGIIHEIASVEARTYHSTCPMGHSMNKVSLEQSKHGRFNDIPFIKDWKL